MPSFIGDEINAATRSLHTPLNRQLLSLLPLALPPDARTPLLFACGISHFLPIYSTFESSFLSLLASPSVPPRTMMLLEQLHMPGLQRADRLRRDLERMYAYCGVKDRRHFGKGEKLTVFLEHIAHSINIKPHLLIAYTWIFYMALFSGGRHIRCRLQMAGSDFWGVRDRKDLPLSFWEFPDGTNDGQDLKTLYKSQVLNLSTSLTETERQDIIAEGEEIMRWMLTLVAEAQELYSPMQVAVTVGELRPPEQPVQAMLRARVPEQNLPPTASPSNRITSFAKGDPQPKYTLIELLKGFWRAITAGFIHRSSDLIKPTMD